MSEMVEPVAEAIGNVLARDSTGECLLCSNEQQREELARAAIAAMREPTANMVDGAPFRDLAETTWEFMIDEALK